MKTKILFLLTAIVLSCAGAYAQIEPLVGDVNEDNIVDVADIAAVVGIIKDGGSDMKGDINEDGVVSGDDIAAIIAIMKSAGGIVDNNYYFSIGTTAPTADNYSTVNNATTTIPTITRYSPTQRNYHYILVPSNKTITIVDDSDDAPINFTEQTSISIPNHKVYKTNGALNPGGTVRITLS